MHVGDWWRGVRGVADGALCVLRVGSGEGREGECGGGASEEVLDLEFWDGVGHCCCCGWWAREEGRFGGRDKEAEGVWCVANLTC